MKKYSFIAMLAVVAMAAFSCAKEVEQTVNKEDIEEVTPKVENPLVITAYADDDIAPDTKTSLSGVSVIWADTDEVAAYKSGDAKPHSSTSTAVANGGKKATFTFSDLTVGTDVTYLIYPADAAGDEDSGYYSINIPTEQAATANSFADGANIAMADGSVDPDAVQFKNLGALIGIIINNDDIESVKISANQEMTGNGIADSGFEAISDGGKKYVKLTGGLTNGTPYYAVIYPGTYTGLKIEVTNTSGQVATYTNSTPLTIARNGNLFIADLTIPGEKWVTPTKGSEYSWTMATGNFVFEDAPATSINQGTPSMTWNADYTFTNSEYIGNIDASKGQQIGSGSNPCSALTLSTSEYAQYVQSIKVNFSHASSGGAALSITVGDVALKNGLNAVANATTSPTEYTFTAASLVKGDIVLSFTNSASKAFYIKSIVINPDNRTPVSLSFDNDAIEDQTTVIHPFTGQPVISSPDVSAITSNISWSITGDAITSSFNTSSGALVLSGATGTATITASFDGDENYRAAEASYTITVTAPYTASEAYAAATTTSVPNVTVIGIVSAITTAFDTDKVTYTLSNDGLTTGDQFTVYKGAAASADDVLVGDCVIVKGTLIKYNNTTPEFSQGAVIQKRLRAPSFTGTENFETNTSVTLSSDAGATIYYTVDGSEPSTLSSVYSSALNISATTTVKAFAVKDGLTTGVVTKTYTKVSSYAVTFATPSNGTITVKHGETVLTSGNTVLQGETVTVITTPSSGYKLATLVYNDGEDHDIKATMSFTMPASAVSITASFVIDSGPAVGTVLFSETFDTAADGTSAMVYYSSTGTVAAYNSSTYGSTINYVRSNNSNVTVENANSAGGTAKQIMVNKNGGSLTISGIKTYGVTRVNVSFKYICSKTSAPITSTCGSTNSGDFSSTSATTASYDATVSGDTFTLVIQKTSTANSTAARFDDIVITVAE